MNDDELLEFVKAYNELESAPTTALDVILSIYKMGFGIYKQHK